MPAVETGYNSAEAFRRTCKHNHTVRLYNRFFQTAFYHALLEAIPLLGGLEEEAKFSKEFVGLSD